MTDGIHTWVPGDPIVELRLVDSEKYTMECIFMPSDSEILKVAADNNLNYEVIRNVLNSSPGNINTLVIDIPTFRAAHGGYRE